jgi:chemotaxis protein MotB
MLERFRGDSDVEMERTDDGYRFVLREAVLYGSGSAELTSEGRQVLQRVADALSGGQHPVRIEGHTDDTPVQKEETLQKFPRGNMDLSVQRALAVWEYLVKDGKIDPRRVSVAGYGEHRPRVPNDSDRNRWRNRRVEIRVAEE